MDDVDDSLFSELSLNGEDLVDTLTDHDFVLQRFIDSYREEEAKKKDIRDYWYSSNNKTVVKLPAIKCSKYTVIGNPSMEKRRRTREVEAPTWNIPSKVQEQITTDHRMTPKPAPTIKITARIRRKKKGRLDEPIELNETPKLQKQETMELSDSSVKKTPSTSRTSSRPVKSTATSYLRRKPPRELPSMDSNTLLDSENFKRLYRKITQPERGVMPGPLDCSPRFQDVHLEVEPQLLREKMLVLGDFLQTSRLQRYRQDRAVIPAAFPEVFRSKTFTRHYVTALYVDEQQRKMGRANTQPNCVKNKHAVCHFCDVVGNKYCKECIENKNKWFAAKVVRKAPHRLNMKVDTPLPGERMNADRQEINMPKVRYP